MGIFITARLWICNSWVSTAPAHERFRVRSCVSPRKTSPNFARQRMRSFSGSPDGCRRFGERLLLQFKDAEIELEIPMPIGMDAPRIFPSYNLLFAGTMNGDESTQSARTRSSIVPTSCGSLHPRQSTPGMSGRSNWKSSSPPQNIPTSRQHRCGAVLIFHHSIEQVLSQLSCVSASKLSSRKHTFQLLPDGQQWRNVSADHGVHFLGGRCEPYVQRCDNAPARVQQRYRDGSQPQLDLLVD